ncbi:MAG: hypothetical protein WC141_04770 [Arcobacteraceae bacterium]
MKHFILVMILIINSYALDELSAMNKDNKEVLNAVLTKLELEKTSNANKMKIFNEFSFALEKDWYVKWWDQNSASKSKVSKEDTKFVEMIIVDENRIYSFTFVYFKKKNQIFITRRQFVASTSEYLLEKFKEFKKDSEYTVSSEKNNYAYLTKKEYLIDSIIHIDDTFGIVSYLDMIVIDL